MIDHDLNAQAQSLPQAILYDHVNPFRDSIDPRRWRDIHAVGGGSDARQRSERPGKAVQAKDQATRISPSNA